VAQSFDAEYFKNRLRTSWVGSEFICIKKIHSTNSFLKECPLTEFVHGMVVLAEQQTDGRGQYEKKWESAPYQNLTFTIGFKPPIGTRLALLTLGCAWAVAEALDIYTDKTVKIKWPNDLLVDGKKIGGLLTESKFCGSKPERVIIGIGLNIFQKKFSKNLAHKAVCLESISNKKISRELILRDCLFNVEKAYHQWHKHDLNLLKSINSRLVGYGEWVRLSVYRELQDEEYKFIGVSDQGELLMLNRQLDVNKFSYEQVRIITGKQRVSKTDQSISA